MDNRTERYPSICIDMKKGRMRIHKETLYLLGEPKYIEILVNPKKKGFIVRNSAGGKNSHSVELAKLIEVRQCYELYSRQFIREINTLSDSLKKTKSYRITGHLNLERNAAFFSLDDATVIDNGKDVALYA